MPDQVPDTVVRERLERLLELQHTITLERNERWLGRETTVLLDRLVGRASDMDAQADGRGAMGRTIGQALEIDGVVHIADARGAQPGARVQVRITEALDDDLIGELVQGGGAKWQR
jgi:ribosomal protein S12 methylthiotransferase